MKLLNQILKIIKIGIGLEYQKQLVIKEIIRKGRPLFVREMTVAELDKSKCSTKFLEHNLPLNTIVNVKCYQNGDLDLRGKKEEYRIIVEDGK